MGRSLVFLVMACAALFLDSRSGKSAVTCVEAPSSVVSTTAMRKSIRSECDPAAAKSEAREAAAHHVLDGLGPTCTARISNATARRLCANAGMTWIGDQAIRTFGETDSLASKPAAGQPALASSLGIPPRPSLCVALRDLPAQSSTTTTGDSGCFFNGFKKTTVLWRMRGHCGVICIGN